MEGKIRRLSAALANQIAAGEVVERPASVAKELVENALDAGATRIRVDIEQGGLALIRVSDDGEGMTESDALLSLERHATSKIATIDDLQTIDTFGFRGEALPSIASVSRLTLCTRVRGANAAIEITMGDDGKPEIKPASRAEGTTIDVRELFYNVPARRKFLKSPATESAHVGEVALWAALARPDVSITVARDGKVGREYLRVNSRRDRALQVLSESRLEECIAERGPMKLEAHLGPPERARAGAVALYTLVNGRPVKDRLLARAVAQAYGSVLEPGRYPVGVVYVDLPFELVDVNVHPQKSEVRFQDARAIFDAITRELFDRLAKAYAIPALGPPSRPWMRPTNAPSAPSTDATYAPPSQGWPQSLGELASESMQTPPSEGPRTQPSLFEEPVGFYSRLKFLAQVRSTYLVCEGDDGLYVIDQHAADERINFDRLRTSFLAREVASQRLLVPEMITLGPLEVGLLTEHETEVSALGLDVRAVGPTTVAVHSVPKILQRAAAERLVHDVLAELSRASTRPFSGATDLVLATMACHGSVRAGDPMSPQQARGLLESLDRVDFSGHCPHGRPVVMRLSYADLERRVGR